MKALGTISEFRTTLQCLKVELEIESETEKY